MARIDAIGRLIQRVEGRNGRGVGPVPAAAVAFEAFCAEFALGLRGTTADLPAMISEPRITMPEQPPASEDVLAPDEVVCHEWLDGLLKHYQRKTA